MAETVLAALATGLPSPLDRLSLLVLPESGDTAAALLDQHGGRLAVETSVHTSLEAFLSAGPSLVAECAGHGAVRAYGPPILASGRDLIVISVGSLSDDALFQALRQAAREGGSRLVLPAGAIGGIDVLAAARLSGLTEVAYIGRKPPHAWRGTDAERRLDLNSLTEAATFYEGTAREAARDYPQNANVAATVALSGLGFDRTRVRLIADPGVTRNVHEVSVRSACADFTIRLEGIASPANPKTSLTAGFSVAREVLNRLGTVVI